MAPPLTTKNGWSQSGKLKVGDTSRMVSLACNFESLKAQNYTVQFDIRKDVNGTQPVRAKAKIFWSVEGNTISRTVTVGSPGGMSLTGVGQAVKIQVIDDVPPEWGGATSDEYDVSISVTPGTRGSFSNPPRFQIDCTAASVGIVVPTSFVTLTPAQVAAFFVPNDCGANSFCFLVATAGAAPPVLPNQRVQVQQLSNALTLAFSDIQIFEWVPLVPGCEQLSVTNTFTSNISLTCLLGIDG